MRRVLRAWAWGQPNPYPAHPPAHPPPVPRQVVAFVKGTRTQPQCGFSHQVLTILTEVRCGVGAGVCVRTHTCARVYAVVVVVVVVEVVVGVGGCKCGRR